MKPHVTVHMITSVDGRIRTSRWSPFEGRGEYEKVHDLLDGDAWMCGRVTMSGYARGEPYPAAAETLPRTDHIARRDAPGYAVALDASGKLCWGRDAIDADHLVVVVSEDVSDGHLAGLRRDGVSYVFGGRGAIDFARVLETLNREFGIRRLLVEGGGGINGSLLKAGLVDELSLLLAPAVDGLAGGPALFDYDGAAEDETPKGLRLSLVSSQPREGGVMWLRYRVDRG
ncbi:dihydrofolate reductase family protein [Lichenibacterium ramalinae]|uniref:RibD family protein n=1 Tax=Lichenibacterium ramalinae TaxID=2316527 RepID=A0A4Q2RAU5_9HYPH|nr:RibD family protein [Lichenibacterium ramalinae]RYB04211.1 RibD family protein [Lichenibacterium ramalinae]